jgi:hypothetical protein
MGRKSIDDHYLALREKSAVSQATLLGNQCVEALPVTELKGQCIPADIGQIKMSLGAEYFIPDSM